MRTIEEGVLYNTGYRRGFIEGRSEAMKLLVEREATKPAAPIPFTPADGIPLDRLIEICAAERDGRVVVLPPIDDDAYSGLKVKYRVYKARNNEPVEGCFVLRPEKDKAARNALRAYAVNTENEELRDDIFRWLDSLTEPIIEAYLTARAEEVEAALTKEGEQDDAE